MYGPIGTIGARGQDLSPWIAVAQMRQQQVMEQMRRRQADEQFAREMAFKETAQKSSEKLSELEMKNRQASRDEEQRRYEQGRVDLMAKRDEEQRRYNTEQDQLAAKTKEEQARYDYAKQQSEDKKAAADAEKKAAEDKKVAEDQARGHIQTMISEYTSKYQMDPEQVRTLLQGQTPQDPEGAAQWSRLITEAMDDVYRAENQQAVLKYNKAKAENEANPPEKATKAPELTPGQRLTYWSRKAEGLQKAKQKLVKAVADPEYAQYLGISQDEITTRMEELNQLILDAQTEIETIMAGG